MKQLLIDKKAMITTTIIVVAVLLICTISATEVLSNSILDIDMLVALPLTVIWIVDLNKKITHRHIRHYTFLTGIFLIFWNVVQYAKFRGVFLNQDIIRYCWYFYYIPMTVIPLFLFLSSLYFGKNDNVKISWKWNILGLIALVLIGLVLTNDLHQLAFKWTGPDHNNDYEHNVVYFIEVIWNVILLAGTLINAIRQATTKAFKRFGFFPFLLLLIGGVYNIFLVIFPRISLFLSFSESYWLMIIAFFESLCAIRLIPTNVGYEDYFDKSTINAIIVDRNLHPVYRTSGASNILDEYISPSIESPYFVDENTRISSKLIKGGHAIYSEDLTALNEAKHKMEEYNSAMFERNELLRSENELLKKGSTIEVNEQLFSKIFDFIRNEYEVITSTIEGMNPNDEDFIKKIKTLSVIDSYLKRISNLILLKEKNQYISLKDLEYSLNETFEYLNLKGVASSFNISDTSKEVESSTIVEIYHLIWRIIFNSLDTVESIFAYLEIKGDNITLKVNLEGENTPLDEDAFTRTLNEGESVYSLTIKGGVRNA